MVLKIEQDYNRFKAIVRGKIKKEFRKFISNGELIGKKGRELISIPLPQIDIPHFTYGSKQKGGVGQGEGEVGDPVGGSDEEEGADQAGNLPGQHILEVEVSLEELAQIMGEELELPRIEPKGRSNIVAVRNKYSTLRRTGPESLSTVWRWVLSSMSSIRAPSGLIEPITRTATVGKSRMARSAGSRRTRSTAWRSPPPGISGGRPGCRGSVRRLPSPATSPAAAADATTVSDSAAETPAVAMTSPASGAPTR